MLQYRLNENIEFNEVKTIKLPKRDKFASLKTFQPSN